MKKLFYLLLLLISFLGAKAQDQISWKVFFEPETPTIGSSAKLIFEASLKPQWHIYGTVDECDGMGPLLTVVEFSQKLGFETTGKLKAIGFSKHLDESFGCNVIDKSGTARFELPIKITEETVVAKGQLDFMVCKDEFGCIPLDYVFNKVVKAEKAKEGFIKNVLSPKEEIKPRVESKEIDQKIEQSTIPNSSSENCNLCQKVDSLNAVVSKLNQQSDLGNAGFVGCDLERKAGWDDIEVVRFAGKEDAHKSWGEILWFIFGAFLAGLVTVFTPCVFPMLPMTVTFFTKKNKTKGKAVSQALIYGFSIVFIYTAFGVVVGKTFGEEFVNELSVNWVVNLIFFLIFVIFALSFLGMFEITLPSKWVNNIDAQADKGGMIGTFFMAFALVLVSFSCTGPIVGSIIILAANGQWVLPTLTMLAFSVAFALPFTITALFPSLLSKLPKSGGWLNSIKVVLGLGELALSLKFLSQIDQVLNLRILDREVFIVIWIAIFITIAIYLFGRIRFPHDSELEKISAPRGVLAISSLAFALYLLPGMWGAPLKSFAGIFPPLHTQDFVLGQEADGEYLCDKPMYGEELHIAHDIKGYFDLRQAICCAKAQNKPLFLDFTGKTCSNCRKMEADVWSDPRVLKMLKEDFVVASLYTDYNIIEIAKEEQYTAKDGREIKKLGKSLQDFQKTKFESLTLPMYSVLGYDTKNSSGDKIVLKELAPTHAYNASVEDYLTFLRAAKENYKRLNSKEIE